MNDIVVYGGFFKMGTNDNTIYYNRDICIECARAFFDAACLIERQHQDSEFMDEMLAPYSVNLMLSCELYYKYLLIPHIDAIPPNRFKTHSIEALHKMLTEHEPDIAKRIENLYASTHNEATPIFLSFEKILEKNKENFVDFRYLYELNKEKHMYSTDMAIIVRALQQVCE